VRRCVTTFFPPTFTRVFEDYAAGRKSRAPKNFAAVPAHGNSMMDAEKNRPREQPRLYDFTAPGLDQRTKR
jgi:hypothetical protein